MIAYKGSVSMMGESLERRYRGVKEEIYPRKR